MSPAKHLLPGLLALTSITIVASPVTTIEYDFKTEISLVNHAPTIGNAHVTSANDGPNFLNVSRLAGTVEVSDDDGRTTYLGGFNLTPVNTPLAPELGDIFAPIFGTIEGETLSSVSRNPARRCSACRRAPTPSITRMQLWRVSSTCSATRRRSTRALLSRSPTSEVSASALRVAFSRGTHYVLCQRAEVFTGLPSLIKGTIESAFILTKVRVEAVSVHQ